MSNTIDLDVYKNTLKRSAGFAPVSGERGYSVIVCHFKQDDDWDNITVLNAGFYVSEKDIVRVSMTIDNTDQAKPVASVTIPTTLLEEREPVYFGLIGSYSNSSNSVRIATNVVRLDVAHGIVGGEPADEEVLNKWEELMTAINAGFALKEDKNNKVTSIENAESITDYPSVKGMKDYVSDRIANKADKATTLAGYGITDAYTKTQTNNLLDGKSNASHTHSQYLTAHQDISGKEDKSNKIQDYLPAQITTEQKHLHYPSVFTTESIIDDKLAEFLLSEVPLKTSDLANDSGFLTQHQDISGKLDKLAEGTANKIITSTAGGAVQRSIYSASPTASNITNGEIAILPTCSAIKEYVLEELERGEYVGKNGVNEVTPQNLQIVDAVISKNLYDPESVSQGYMRKDGSIAGVDFTHTDYIPVVAGDYYYFSQYMNDRQRSMSVHNVCCFDSNKNVLPDLGTDVQFEGLYLVPEGVSFIRTSNYKHISFSKWQIEHGNEMTEYEPYGLLSAVIKDEFIPPVSIGQIPAFHLVEGQNILNRNDPDFANDKFLNANGTISDNSGYVTSGFIPVKSGDRLIGSYKTNNAMGPVTLRTIAAYNAEKAAVSSLGKYSVPDFTVPNGIAYVRICYSGGTYGENVQIQKVLPGESYYPYKEYEEPHYELKSAYMYKIPSTPEHVFLPTDIYVAVGRTIELYNEQIVLDHEKYHFKWECIKGAAYKRKFSITGQTVGNYYLDLFLYDDKMNLCWKGRSTVHVVAASNPVKKILPIGDSLTNWKAWLQETILLSSNNISFVGTRYSGESRDSENNLYPSGTIHSEGRSGWAADAYLSNATYTFDNRYDGVPSVDGSANPFWDGEKFSLSHYLSVQTGVPTPDAVQIFLGTNDISDGVDVAVSNISQMVNTIRSEYPDMPIFVCNTIYRSNQNGYGSVGSDAYAGGSGASSWQYDQDSKVMELALGLRNSLANVSGIYFVPLMSCMDREYDFGQVMTKVNPRSSVEIPMPVESVHPQAVGYYQMADIMYSTYCGVLS